VNITFLICILIKTAQMAVFNTWTRATKFNHYHFRRLEWGRV